jgi:hypothetical protein
MFNDPISGGWHQSRVRRYKFTILPPQIGIISPQEQSRYRCASDSSLQRFCRNDGLTAQIRNNSRAQECLKTNGINAFAIRQQVQRRIYVCSTMNITAKIRFIGEIPAVDRSCPFDPVPSPFWPNMNP